MIDIKKTYKNYVDGKYVRSESGKTYTKELKNEFYELPLTSRKDVRDTVTSSKSGFNKWNGLTPYTSCLLYTSPSPRDGLLSRMPSSA